VTICRNAEATIAKTIRSIQAQDYTDYEHIVVDGASTDRTADMVRAMLRDCDLVVSEPDHGISDALNKGVALARGRFIQFVHADDWLSQGQLRASVETLAASNAEFVFGDLLFFRDGNPDHLYRGDPNYPAVIDGRCPALNHPTVLARREAFERIGLFRLKYRCAMDYDWFLRLHRSGGRGEYSPRILGCMNHDGVSNTAFVRTMREVRDIAVSFGRNPVRAQVEFGVRVAKTTIGRHVQRSAGPAYSGVRRLINPSYAEFDASLVARSRLPAERV
jgi:glycosyltransferase involved in cell wall biosynthesis